MVVCTYCTLKSFNLSMPTPFYKNKMIKRNNLLYIEYKHKDYLEIDFKIDILRIMVLKYILNVI